MTPELYETPLRSNPETYSLNNTIVIKPDYLSAARTMDAPEVWALFVEFTGTVGAVSGGALGRDAAKLFSNIRFRSGSDDVYNASGPGGRIVEQLEWGISQVDPADIASAATNTTYTYILRIPFALPKRAVRQRDTAIPLEEFMDGGEFALSTPAAVPTGWATVQNDWKLRIFADVRDGRVPELKTRRRIKEEAVTQQEFDYQVNGTLRSAILSSYLTTTGHTSLTGFTTLNSRTLKWPAAYQTSQLIDRYRRESESLASGDEFVRATTAAIPLHIPRRAYGGQGKIGTMPMMKSLHLDLLAAAPTGGRLITDVLIERDAYRSAQVLGYDSPQAAQAAVKAQGRVVGAAGNYGVTSVPSALSARLPIRTSKPKG